MASPRYCGRPLGAGDSCTYLRMKGKQRCVWHWLLAQPSDVQADYAWKRYMPHVGGTFVARVPSTEWPPGERWCSGCQEFVPLFYTSGSRCKAHTSVAAHSARVESVYGITGAQYAELLAWQRGVCYICQRRPGKKRLAVDHDHTTGEVRGLLCASNEHGCNRGVVAILESAHDGGVAAAKRALNYLVNPPTRQMAEGVPPVEPRARPAPVRAGLVGGPPDPSDPAPF